MTTRAFHLGDVLSVTTGYLVSPRHMDALYDVLNFMTDDNLFTHQLPRAIDECRPHILAQHPDLARVCLPDAQNVNGAWQSFDDEAHLWRWLAEQVDRYGPERDLRPIPAEDHTVIDPIAELLMMKPDAEIIAVDLGGAS